MAVRPLRHELKFLVHHGVRPVLLERWRRHLIKAPFTNEHAVSPILSQYYDSPLLAFYREKLDGVAIRNKVRLRTYGREYKAGQTAFLEIKHRENDAGRKYRYRFPDFDPAYLDPARWRFDDPQVLSAFAAMSECYRLCPSAQVYYQREAYEGLVERDVRVTFDSCLMGLHPGETLTRAVFLDRSRCLLPDTLQILEVKATHGIPGWVHEGVLAAELRRQTISKYIAAVDVLRLAEMGMLSPWKRVSIGEAGITGQQSPDRSGRLSAGRESSRRKAA